VEDEKGGRGRGRKRVVRLGEEEGGRRGDKECTFSRKLKYFVKIG
jgi:hypothetical protein